MNKPISVGDLVQIIHWSPCGCALGLIRTVKGFGPIPDDGCSVCRTPSLRPFVAGAIVGATGGTVPLAWLKRIPPIEELEGEKQKEDIREPA